MEEKPLCIRTFAEVLQTRMNVKVLVKYSETDRAVYKNFQKDIYIYPVLIQSLAHGMSDEEAEALPEIDKTVVSRLKGGKKDLPNEYLALLQRRDIIKSVGTYFAQTLTTPAYITKESLRIAVDAIADIAENDTALGKTTIARLKKLRSSKTEADYLAEVWVVAVRNNKNFLASHAANGRKEGGETMDKENKQKDLPKPIQDILNSGNGAIPNITINYIEGDKYDGNAANKSLGSNNTFNASVYMGESSKEGR